MTKAEIITKFRLYMDDTTDLSSQEESDLFDKYYQEVCDYPYQFLLTSYTGTQSTTVPYVSLPTDFAYLSANENHSDNSYYARGPVVYVGSNYAPYTIVSFADRRSYRNHSNTAYVDIGTSRLYFTIQPSSAAAIEYDYFKVPASIASNAEPLVPERYQDAIYHLMCADDFVIQQSDKAKSYREENLSKAEDIIMRMKYWNSQLIQQ